MRLSRPKIQNHGIGFAVWERRVSRYGDEHQRNQCCGEGILDEFCPITVFCTPKSWNAIMLHEISSVFVIRT